MTAFVVYRLEDGLRGRSCRTGVNIDDIPLNAVESIECSTHELKLALQITGRTVPFETFTFVDSQAREIVANWR